MSETTKQLIELFNTEVNIWQESHHTALLNAVYGTAFSQACATVQAEILATDNLDVLRSRLKKRIRAESLVVGYLAPRIFNDEGSAAGNFASARYEKQYTITNYERYRIADAACTVYNLALMWSSKFDAVLGHSVPIEEENS